MRRTAFFVCLCLIAGIPPGLGRGCRSEAGESEPPKAIKTTDHKGVLLEIDDRGEGASGEKTLALRTEGKVYRLAFNDKDRTIIPRALKLVGTEVIIRSRLGTFDIGRVQFLLVLDVNPKEAKK